MAGDTPSVGIDIDQQLGLGELPRGRHNLSREFVEQHQRRRLLDAALAIVHEIGINGLTATRLVAKARVSRSTFYSYFEDCEDCLGAAYTDSFERLNHVLDDAYTGSGSWLERFAEVLLSLTRTVDAEPLSAELCFLQAPAGDPIGRACYQDLVMSLVEMLADGRGGGARRSPSAALGDELLATGILAMMARRLGGEERPPAGSVVDGVIRGVIAPTLGLRGEETAEPLAVSKAA